MTVGEQIAEALVAHKRLPRREIAARVRAMLEAVRINDPDRVAVFTRTRFPAAWASA